jgi:hypothetical protein
MVMTRSSVLALPALALLGGCQFLIGLDGGQPGSTTTTSSAGGGGATSSSSTGGHGGTTSSSTSAGGGGTASTTSTLTTSSCATGTCGAPGDCPSPPECAERTCDASCCGTKPAALGTTCTTGGKVCGDPAGSKAGVCVECNTGAECGSKVCSGHACQAPTCNDGVQNGGEIAVDCGGSCGPCKGTVLLAAGPSGSLAAALDAAGTWAATALAQASSDAPSLAYLPALHQAVGLVRDGADGLAHFTLWDGAGWSAFANVSPFLVSTTTPAFDGKLRGASTLVGIADTAYAIHWDSQFRYWHQSYSAGAWSTPAALTLASQPVCSAYSARYAALAGAPKAAFVTGSCLTPSNHAYAVDAASAAAQNAQDASGSALLPWVDITTFPDIPPAIIALSGGTADLMMAYLRCPTSGCTTLQVFWTVRTASTSAWSAPTQVPNGVITADPVALAPLPNGGAMLAFRGTNGKLYAMPYSAATGWGSTAPVNLAPAATIPSPPALVKGVGAADVELAFVDGADMGRVKHMRFSAGTWTGPDPVGAATGLARVALASGP